MQIEKILLMSCVLLAILASVTLPGTLHADDTTTVNLYTWRPSDEVLWKQINRQNLIPGVTVEVNRIADLYRETLLVLMQSSQVDVFMWRSGAANIAVLIDNGLIEPYPGDLSHMNESALIAGRGADEKYYGVPFAVQMQAIMVNKKVLRKLGINSVPTTLPELESVFSRLKSAGITPLHIAGWAEWYNSQLLGEVLMAGIVEEGFAQQLAEGKACFTDARYVEIFSTLDNWNKKGFLNADMRNTGDYTTMFNSVAFGSSAMGIEGGWMTSKAEPYYRMDPSFEFDFWTIPGKSGKFYALGDGTFQVATTSRHTTAAQKVLDFTTTKMFAEMFAQYAQQLPAYGGKINIAPGDLNSMADLVAAKPYPVSLYNTYAINRKEPTYNQLVAQSMAKLLTGEFSPEQATTHIQNGLNSWGYPGAALCAK